MNSETILYTYLTTLYRSLCILFMFMLFVSPPVKSINRSGNQMYFMYIMNNDVIGFTLQCKNTVSDYKVGQILKYTGVFQFNYFLFISTVAYE